MFWLGKSIQIDPKSEAKGLSPIEFLVLAHLRSRELRNKNNVGQYGYEMIQDLNDMFAGSWEAKSGTIYPILTKLDKDKHLLMEDVKQSQLGPVKKVYILTEEGRKLIDIIVHDRFASDVDFILHYIELLTPFILLLDEQNPSEEIFEKLMQIPAKAQALAMEQILTDVDVELRNRKLTALKANLEKVIRNIDQELGNSPN